MITPAAAAEETLWLPPEPVRRRWSTWLVHGLKAVVAIGLIGLLVHTIQVAAIEQAISGANPLWIAGALLLLPANLYLQVKRWQTAIRAEMPDVTVKQAYTSFLGGASMGIITPGRVGEIGRVFLLNPKSRVRLAGLHVLDKLYFMAALACFGPALVYLMPGFSEHLHQNLQLPLLIATLILPLFFVVFSLTPDPLRSLLVLIRRGDRFKGSLNDLLHALDKVRARDSRVMAGLTVAQFGVILTQFYLLSSAFQAVKWVTAAHTYVATLFVKSLLPISLGDLGVSEWAAVSFYQRFGIADTTAFSASLLIFTINILIPAIAGIFVLQRVKATNVFGRVAKRIRGKA
ncbi:flippase-like domain-containing protein [bacterium]|nr:flippase-like domain-containing protein [bacterium]